MYTKILAGERVTVFEHDMDGFTAAGIRRLMHEARNQFRELIARANDEGILLAYDGEQRACLMDMESAWAALLDVSKVEEAGAME